MRTVNAGASTLLIISMMGCAGSTPNQYQVWSNDPTPNYWSTRLLWTFSAVGTNGQIERTMTIRFSDEEADTCSTGDWKQVEIISQRPRRSPIYQGEAAYTLDGRALLIDLTANLCDNYTEYFGELTDLGFVGQQKSGGMLGGKIIGPVYGVFR